MPQASYDKRCIALTQLETALRLFEEGQNLFSVITLAGAAEELLGKLLSETAAEQSLDSLKKAAVEMYRALFNEEAGAKQFADRANRAKNELKHHDKGQPHAVTLDLREEAVDILDRAITNYWRLEQSLTPPMTRFADRQRAV